MLKIEYKTYQDYWGYFFRVTQRHQIPGIFEWDKKIVNFIEYVSKIKSPMKILDIACGGGDQAKVFAEKGHEITGIDFVPALVEFAENKFRENSLKGTFIKDDMRNINYENEFDLVTILSGSFGFFSDEDNLKLLISVRKALKTGGKVFIMFITPHYLSGRIKDWIETDEGWYLTEAWFNKEESTYNSTRTYIQKNGTIIEPENEIGYHAHEKIRAYTIPEMKTILNKAGLNYIDSYYDRLIDIPPVELNQEHTRNMVLAEK